MKIFLTGIIFCTSLTIMGANLRPALTTLDATLALLRKNISAFKEKTAQSLEKEIDALLYKLNKQLTVQSTEVQDLEEKIAQLINFPVKNKVEKDARKAKVDNYTTQLILLKKRAGAEKEISTGSNKEQKLINTLTNQKTALEQRFDDFKRGHLAPADITSFKQDFKNYKDKFDDFESDYGDIPGHREFINNVQDFIIKQVNKTLSRLDILYRSLFPLSKDKNLKDITLATLFDIYEYLELLDLYKALWGQPFTATGNDQLLAVVKNINSRLETMIAAMHKDLDTEFKKIKAQPIESLSDKTLTGFTALFDDYKKLLVLYKKNLKKEYAPAQQLLKDIERWQKEKGLGEEHRMLRDEHQIVETFFNDHKGSPEKLTYAEILYFEAALNKYKASLAKYKVSYKTDYPLAGKLLQEIDAWYKTQSIAVLKAMLQAHQSLMRDFNNIKKQVGKPAYTKTLESFEKARSNYQAALQEYNKAFKKIYAPSKTLLSEIEQWLQDKDKNIPKEYQSSQIKDLEAQLAKEKTQGPQGALLDIISQSQRLEKLAKEQEIAEEQRKAQLTPEQRKQEEEEAAAWAV